ncbi:MAG: FtsX-like permease family protein [Minwuiales bacterium]|nr:FtsX-like permease family protein [Minwuiales bacterium]
MTAAPKPAAALRTAWAFARRELRGGLKGFRIFLACLTLGVTAIAGVGSLSSAIVEGMRDNGRAILGGDVALRLTHRPASDEELAWLTGEASVSRSMEMRSMASAASDNNRGLVELKAVDGGYPHYGAITLESGEDLDAVLGWRDGRWGAVAEAQLLRRLGLEIGDGVKVGDLIYDLRGVIAQEPDRAAGGMVLGPRLMVSIDSMADTGLVQIGSLIRYHYRLKLPAGTDVTHWTDRLRDALPNAGWRIRDHTNGAPSLQQFVERMTLFLTLVGLSALLVGGVGVGNAVRGYLDGKTSTIATLKCLGAPGAFVFQVYLIQILMLALGGIVIGLALGAGIPMAAVAVFSDLLPVPATIGVYWQPLALATLYGILTALAFALWPLARAREVPAAGLFRQIVAPTQSWPRPGYVVATVAAVALLAGVAVLTAEEKKFAAWFVLGAAGCFALLRFAAAGIMAAARRAGRPRQASLRLAIANLHRPGAPTGSVVLSLGLGLTLLVAVASIEGNMAQQVNERLPEEAPAFFFVDIQNAQLPEFLEAANAVPGVSSVRHVPSLRGRITAIAGVPSNQIDAPPEARWVLRGDRGLTYAAEPPENNEIVAGEWWPPDYAGPPLISFEAETAGELGIEIGDTITVNVLGRDITGTVANLRHVDWSTLGINFVLVFDPHTLAAAPHTHIATAEADGPAEEALFDTITTRFANVTAVRMKEALEIVNELLANIGAAVRATASVTLLAGVLVLGGAMAAGHSHRVYDAVVLKVLGATRRNVLTAYLAEYTLLGVVTAAIAAVAGTVAAWAVLTQVMNADWIFLPGTVALTVVLSVAVTVGLGLAGTWRALSQKAMPVLRTE